MIHVRRIVRSMPMPSIRPWSVVRLRTEITAYLRATAHNRLPSHPSLVARTLDLNLRMRTRIPMCTVSATPARPSASQETAEPLLQFLSGSAGEWRELTFLLSVRIAGARLMVRPASVLGEMLEEPREKRLPEPGLGIPALGRHKA
eukprot:6306607-Prymnesium_polylepis.1